MGAAVLSKPDRRYVYDAAVIRWIDGDTVDLEVDLGFESRIKSRFRLAGIDAPELRDRDEGKRTAARSALSRVKEIAPAGSVVRIQTSKPDPRDKYGRWLCRIWGIDPAMDVGTILCIEGLAVATNGKR
jgi:micrococcal nuclease